MKRADIRPPYTHEHIFGTFKAELHEIQSTPEYVALTERGQRPRIVVVVDAISSTPGLRMPWERVVKYCKTQENVLSVVDGAHAIGQIVGINLSETQPDFWASVGFFLVMWVPETKLLWFNRPVANGCLQSEPARFFMFH